MPVLSAALGCPEASACARSIHFPRQRQRLRGGCRRTTCDCRRDRVRGPLDALSVPGHRGPSASDRGSGTRAPAAEPTSSRRSVADAESRLKPLMEATSTSGRPRPHYPRCAGLLAAAFEHDGVRHIGILTGKPPDPFKMAPRLARMDHLIVPSVHNLAALAKAGAFRLQHWRRISVARRCSRRPRAPCRAGEIPRHPSGRHRCSTQSTPGPRANGWRRSLTALCAFGRGPGCARVKTSREVVRRPAVSGARSQREPHGGGDHRPRRRGSRRPPPRIAVVADDDLVDNFIDPAAHAGASFRFLVAVRGFRAWRVRRRHARTPR